MPIFNNTNPNRWILKAERYLGFHRFSNDGKLEVVVIRFEGDALLWYRWETKKRPIAPWEEMKLLILKHFRATQTGSLHEQLLAIKEEGIVHEYRRRFIEKSAPLNDLFEEVTLSAFMNGLQSNLRTELQILEPTSIGRAMDLTQ